MRVSLRRLRLTSPGTLLILAVLSIGGIFLLDVVYLRPYVEKRRNDVIRQRVSHASTVLRKGIACQSDTLLRICRAWAVCERMSQLLSPGPAPPGQAADLPPWAIRAFDATMADLVWFRNGAGEVVRMWSRARGSGGPKSARGAPGAAVPRSPSGTQNASRASVDRKQIAAALAGQDAGFSKGLFGINGRVLLAACQEIPAGEDGRKPLGQIGVGRYLGGAALSDLCGLVGGKNICFLAEADLPLGTQQDPTGSFGFSAVQEDRSAVAAYAALHDAAGNELGYLKAELPVGQVYRMTATIRRAALVLVSLSLALVMLVILGTQMLISGPVVRLLRRLQDLDGQEVAAKDVAGDLHGEPLVLARRLESAFDKLAHISKTDELTGLANRRHFEEVLDCFYHQARRYSRPLSVMVMDVDFFKAVNDTGGHHTGDEFLKAVAQSIEKACRKADLPARIGGDEFGVVLPETVSSDAAAVAERIRMTVAAQTIRVKSVEVNATLSIGIADLNAGEITSGEVMVAVADEALYRAKQLGRNRVVQAGEVPGVGWQDKTKLPDSKVGALCSKLAGLDNQFQDLFLQAIEEIVEMLERRDPHMADHARKVQRCSVLIAREMELPERIIKRIETAAMLHDIGMLAMPDTVLLCPREFDDEQMRLMRRHPLLGVQIMERMEFLEQEIPAVRYHHERYDGKGYPEGLAGASIPLTARILAVADAFVAMTSRRAFRHPKSQQQALAELRMGARRQFDPGVVEAFVAVAEHLGDELLGPRSGGPRVSAARSKAVANEPGSAAGSVQRAQVHEP